MQENEFEKRLQQEMGEFRIRPSDVVWDKIEEQVRKKKRRRVVFVISLLAGLSLLGYTGYFLFNDKKQNITEQNVTTIDNNKTEKNKIENNNKQEADPSLQKSGSEDQTTIKQDHSTGEEQIAITEKNKTITRRKNQSTDIVKAAKDLNEEKIVREKFPEAKKRPNQLLNETPVKKKELADIKNKESDEKSNKEREESISDETKPIPDQKQNIAARTDSVVVAPTSQSSKATARQAKNKVSATINLGVDLSVGVSKIRKNAFSLSSTGLNADALYNSPGNIGGGPSNSAAPPSAVKQGIAFKAGIVAEKKISKKSSLTAGLSYAYYSNSIRTGAYKDSSFILRTITSQAVALNSYYQGSQQKEYTNRYYFIQLPVYYQLQLNKGIKLPLMWNIGASAGWLVATNALVYDTASGGIYYRNKDAFNKLHFNLNTGLSLRFGKTNKLHWSVGPELSMDMTGLIKNVPDQKRYFLYGGITGRLYFSKKNNK